MVRRTLFALALLLGVVSCSENKNALPEIDGERALQTVCDFCRMPERYPGGADYERSLYFLDERIRQINAQCFTERFTDITPSGYRKFCNLYTEIPGRDSSQFVILATHYDTKRGIKNFCGANDGASSCAVVLEIMRELRKNTPPYTVRICFFDGEECEERYSSSDGLHGSRSHLSSLLGSGRLKELKYVLLLDMVGDKDLRFTLPSDTPENMIAKLRRAEIRYGYENTFGMHHCPIIDDHAPFAALNFDTLNLIDFSFGPDNSYWHTPDDTPDKLSAESLRKAGNLALGILLEP